MDNSRNTNNSSTTLWIVLGVGAVALLCICVGLAVVALSGLTLFGTAVATDPMFSEEFFDPTATPGPPSTIVVSAPPPEAEDVLTMLEEADIPPRDRYDIATRLLGVEGATVEPVGEYQVGDREIFFVENDDTEEVFEIEAEMVYKNAAVYMWVETGQDYDHDGLVRSADKFAEETYPTNRENFGSEPSPGIDSDPRLHILHSVELGSTVAGYFYSPSEYPREVMPYSNEKEIFFINISNTFPGSEDYDSVLAHEFQHMIHFNVDPNEPSWMDEGLSELAAYLNGYGPSWFAYSFFVNPDLQLNSWPEDGDTGPHYGAGFMWNAYFLDRFGVEAMRAVVANQGNGFEGMEAALADQGIDLGTDDIFADWVIANYLNDQSYAPEYGYTDRQLDLDQPSIAGSHNGFPASTDYATVHQFGTDYIELAGRETIRIQFEGATQVQIIPTDTVNTDGDTATNDQFIWWSNRADDSDMTLTRLVDLTGVQSATLEYDVWYWIEDRWDYAYLEVSTDGGDTWEIIETPYTTTDNPHGSSYGSGYTGSSANEPDSSQSGWLHESIDLSEYAGQEIMIRFEYITDDAVNQPGLALDNLCVPALDWCDDAEDQDDTWGAHGFVRHNNILAQKFVVQVIMPDGSVQRIDLDGLNTGEITLALERNNPAILVVSGSTRFTTEDAIYRYTIEAVD